MIAIIGYMTLRQQKLRSQENVDLANTLHLLKSDLESRIERSQDTLSTQVDRKFESNQKFLLDQDFKNRETLDAKLESVNKILVGLNQDLGGVNELSGTIHSLSKVLSNTSRRGAFGEGQLSAIVADYFTTGQYEENWTVPGTSSRVEMAIKVPRTNGEEIYMPIDSKFNMETFRNYLEAEESGENIHTHLTVFINTLKKQIKEVAEKYVKPPHTTEFAIIFIPIESMYQEVMRNGALLEEAFNKYKVNIVGPANLLAVLSAYQMGYKQISITENSRKVYDILVGVKQQVEKFEESLDRAAKQNETVGKTLDELRGARLNQVRRKLDQVDELKLSA